MKIEGYITDKDGCLNRGYPEILLGYKLLLKSIRNLDTARVKHLFFKMQPQCWKMTVSGDLDKLAYVFEEGVLQGEDAEFLNIYARKAAFDNSILQFYLTKLPKVGKYFDTKLIPEAIEIVEKVQKKGVKTGIWSTSFQQLVEGQLKKFGVWDLFDGVKANPWNEEEGLIVGINYQVDVEDKSRGFPDFLGELGLKETGEGVAYVGDSPSDFKIFPIVQFPILAPSVSSRKRVRYQEEGLKDCMFPESYAEIAKELELTD